MRIALLVSAMMMTSVVQAQSSGANDPWFGISLPPGLDLQDSAAFVGTRGPSPAVIPAGEAQHTELRGPRIALDLEAIVAFSRQSRVSRELGGDQLWGRVSGFGSGEATVRWAAQQLSNAGIEDIRLQRFDQDADAGLWLPQEWEVRLLGDEIFGAGSEDVVLETSMALAPSLIEGGELIAPLVYVGKGSSAELLHIDVAGKIAIQHVTPQAHLVFERGSAVPAARADFSTFWPCSSVPVRKWTSNPSSRLNRASTSQASEV